MRFNRTLVCAGLRAPSCTQIVRWPSPFLEVSNMFSIFQLSFADAIPIMCLVEYKFVWNNLLLSTLGPLAVVVCLGLGLFFKGIPSGWKGNNYFAWKTTVIYLSLLLAYFVLPSTSLVRAIILVCKMWCSGRKQGYNFLKQACLIHKFTKLCQVLIRTFLCEPFTDGRAFLKADMRFECDSRAHASPSHVAAMLYASIFIVVYPIGIPVCVAPAIHHHPYTHPLTTTPKRACTYSFVLQIFYSG